MDRTQIDKIKKVVIDSETELSDVLKAISSSQSERIVLAFAEQSDILVSPVNFKTIQDCADEEGKAVVAQIVQNPSGQRNALSAEIVVTSSTDEVAPELWDEAYAKREQRNGLRNSALRKGGNDSYVTNRQVENKDILMPDSNPLNDEDIVDMGILEEEKPLSQFQQKVRSALTRSKEGLTAGFAPKTVNQGGVTVALNHSIESVQGKDTNFAKPVDKLIGRDFLSSRNADEYVETKEVTEVNRFANRRPVAGGDFKQKAGLFFSNLLASIKSGGGKKILLFVGLPSIILAAFVLYYLYTFTPFVKIDVFIESRKVETELSFVGDPSVTALNIDTLKIPVKIETVEKSVSDSARTTETASRGDKASGVVRVLCYLDPTEQPSITIPQGTVLTDSSGKAFTTLSQAFVECPGQQSVTVSAVEVGPESNLSSGTRFTVTGFAFEDVNGTNLTSFSGGKKEDYNVVGQSDYDNLITDLQNIAYQEAKGDLERKASDGWVIISSTVKDKMEGDPVVDATVGTEADIINAEVKTVSTALYYKKSDLESMGTDILLKVAQEQNLFESVDGVKLTLDQDISQQISVESVDAESNTVNVLVKLSGTVKPQIDRNLIYDGVKGKGWDEGISYLESLKFVSKPSEVLFTPESFPERYRYFPDRQGRIQVNIREVEPQQ